jgi:hypothetical protein
MLLYAPKRIITEIVDGREIEVNLLSQESIFFNVKYSPGTNDGYERNLCVMQPVNKKYYIVSDYLGAIDVRSTLNKTLGEVLLS